VDHVFDSMGREVGSDDSMVTEEQARTLYDARGNALKAWAEGLPSAHFNDDAYATVSTFDALSRATSTREPASSVAAATAYDAAGREATVTAADGTVNVTGSTSRATPSRVRDLDLGRATVTRTSTTARACGGHHR
jgi:hypothetical protein